MRESGVNSGDVVLGLPFMFILFSNLFKGQLTEAF